MRTQTFVTLSLLTSLLAAPAAAQAPSVLAPRAEVRDGLSNTPLWTRTGTPKAVEMASTAKTMTIWLALWAIEQGYLSLSSPVVISAKAQTQACNCFPGGEVKVIQAGQALSLEHALFSVALSHGETTVAVAELVANAVHNGYVATGQDWAESAKLEQDFIAMMNAKAKELGLKDTVWRTVHGGPSGDQRTTPADLITLWRSGEARFADWTRFLGVTNQNVLVYGAGLPWQWYTFNRQFNYYPRVEADKNGAADTVVRSSLISQTTRLGRPVVAAAIQSGSQYAPGSQTAFGDVAELFRYAYREIFRPVQQSARTTLSSGAASGPRTSAVACFGSDRGAAAVVEGSSLRLSRLTVDFEPFRTVMRSGVGTSQLSAVSADVAMLSSTRALVGQVTLPFAPTRTASPGAYVSTWNMSQLTPSEEHSFWLGQGSQVKVAATASNFALAAWIRDDGQLATTLLGIDASGTITRLAETISNGTWTEVDVDVSLLSICFFGGCGTKWGVAVGGIRNGSVTFEGRVLDSPAMTLSTASRRTIGGSQQAVSITTTGVGRFGMAYTNDQGRLGRWFVRLDPSGTSANVEDTGIFTHVSRTPVALPIGELDGLVVAGINATSQTHLSVWDRDGAATPSEGEELLAANSVLGATDDVAACRLTSNARKGSYLVLRRAGAQVDVATWGVAPNP